MKKFFPIIIAIVVFLVALILNQPEQRTKVVVAAIDLPDGRILTESDLSVKELPISLRPEGAIDDLKNLVGQRLRVSRSAGDVILPVHLGGEALALDLSPDERAVALSVSAAQGLAGFLKAGDRVGLTVIVSNGQQSFAKYLAGGLRVLWVDPAFRRDAPPQSTPPSGSSGFELRFSETNTSSGSNKGLVILAIPIDAKVLVYDFSLLGANNEERPLYLVDVLPALSAQGAQFGLILEPQKADDLITSGIVLQSLVITPAVTITPTPAQP